VRLVPPRARELAGVQTFRAMASNAFIERVVFLLDGKQVGEDRDDPFAARIDLGPSRSSARSRRWRTIVPAASSVAMRYHQSPARRVRRPHRRVKGEVGAAQGTARSARGSPVRGRRRVDRSRSR
jgi:hypothetical protein